MQDRVGGILIPNLAVIRDIWGDQSNSGMESRMDRDQESSILTATSVAQWEPRGREGDESFKTNRILLCLSRVSEMWGRLSSVFQVVWRVAGSTIYRSSGQPRPYAASSPMCIALSVRSWPGCNDERLPGYR